MEKLDGILVSFLIDDVFHDLITSARIIGLCINFGFNVMLTAAHDLLKVDVSGTDIKNQSISLEVEVISSCNPLSTGSFLIADTFGALVGISIAPFVATSVWIRVLMTAGLSLTSYLVTAFSLSYIMSFAGVFVGAFSAGFGEATIMTYAASYDKDIVSGYSAGMGASGIFSSAAYLTLTFFLSTQVTLLTMVFVPFLLCFAFAFIITSPEEASASGKRTYGAVADDSSEDLNFSYSEKFKQLPPLIWTILVPVFVSTFFMCFINQGLFELVYIDTMPLDRDVQYRLFVTLCQVGLLIGQSSVQLIPIRELWILTLVEGVLCLLVLGEILHPTHLTAPIVVIAVMEGMIGGAAFVNTFYYISQESRGESVTSFNMEMGMIANEVGAVVAGIVAIPTHTFLCSVLSMRGP